MPIHFHYQLWNRKRNPKVVGLQSLSKEYNTANVDWLCRSLCSPTDAASGRDGADAGGDGLRAVSCAHRSTQLKQWHPQRHQPPAHRVLNRSSLSLPSTPNVRSINNIAPGFLGCFVTDKEPRLVACCFYRRFTASTHETLSIRGFKLLHYNGSCILLILDSTTSSSKTGWWSSFKSTDCFDLWMANMALKAMQLVNVPIRHLKWIPFFQWKCCMSNLHTICCEGGRGGTTEDKNRTLKGSIYPQQLCITINSFPIR